MVEEAGKCKIAVNIVESFGKSQIIQVSEPAFSGGQILTKVHSHFNKTSILGLPVAFY